MTFFGRIACDWDPLHILKTIVACFKNNLSLPWLIFMSQPFLAYTDIHQYFTMLLRYLQRSHYL